MKNLFSIFILSCSFLFLSSCNKEAEKSGAYLIDERSYPEFPIDNLRFQWRGDVGQQQKLMLWKDGYTWDTENLNEPDIFQIGIPANFSPQVDDVFVLEHKLWTPLTGQLYHWKVLTYYKDGTVIHSNERAFVPQP
ncbi:MAG: hypothetical protein ACPGSD_13020 [Flavobacteriales bacterium]